MSTGGSNVGFRSSLHMSPSTQHSIATVSVVLLQKVGFQAVYTQPKSVLMEPSSRTDLLLKHALRDVSIVQVHSSHRQSLSGV